MTGAAALLAPLALLAVVCRLALGRTPFGVRRPRAAGRGDGVSPAGALLGALGVGHLLLELSARLDGLSPEQADGIAAPAVLLLLAVAVGLRLPLVQALLSAVGAVASIAAVLLDHGPGAAGVLVVVTAAVVWLHGASKMVMWR